MEHPLAIKTPFNVTLRVETTLLYHWHFVDAKVQCDPASSPENIQHIRSNAWTTEVSSLQEISRPYIRMLLGDTKGSVDWILKFLGM